MCIRDRAGVKLPHIIKVKSSQPVIVSEFLDAIITRTDKETVDHFINIQKLKIANRLKGITLERQLLLIKSKQDRQSQIKRIKEKDIQLLRELNNEIGRARTKAKTARMNQILILTNAAKLASSLGLIENNLNQFLINKSDTNLNSVTITNIPDWYLFGETFLKEMIASLTYRENDDPYIPELAVLNNQINEIKNNTLLQTLEGRLDDDPFIPELAILNEQINEIKNNTLLQTLEGRLDDSAFNSQISQLDIEKLQLESINIDSTGINAIQIYQVANSQKIVIKSRHQLIIAMAIIGSFMLSLVLVFLMNALKEEDVNSIQKNK